jgi:rod shape determining protein RodA
MKWFNFSSIDWLIMIPVAILLAFSLTTLYSIDFAVFKSQLLFTFVSVVVFFFLTQLNPSVLRYYSIPIYIVSLILLIAVLFLGVEARGSVRWFQIGGFSIQFSELLKPLLALSLASYLANLKNYSFKSFISVLVLLAPIALLIFFQPDLGNALIYVFVTLGALVIFGFPFKWFLAGFLMWLATVPFIWTVLHEYQRQRVLTLVDPSRDPLGTSYNAIQAVIAIGSGMMLGKGLGQGTQATLRFLPEHHTDFIFATISEELGFIGATVIIICFAVIFFRLYMMIKNNDDKFAKIFSIIVFLLIFVHFAVNVGMNLAVLPIVGVTLPFVSYGGSSLLSNFVLLGLLFAVNKKSRREVLEIG